MTRILEVEFSNEDDYRIARDIRLDILEREGRLPTKPDLRMLIPVDDWPEIQEKVDSLGVKYEAKEYA